jgi:tetratricopeptide (TPR) repeat protein
MKPIIICLFLFISHSLFSQSPLKTETTFYDVVDKWIAYPLKDSTNTYIAAFIYIDPDQGFVLDIAKKFSLDTQGKFALKKDQPDVSKSPIKILPQKNWGKIYVIPEDKIKELGLTPTPDWLKSYKVNSHTPEHQTKIGSAYNRAGAYQKALDILLPTYNSSPKIPAIGYEIAYSYNALKQYQNAIDIADKELAKFPQNCILYREKMFSFFSLQEVEKAENTYKKAGENCTDQKAIIELGFGLAQVYFSQKDEAKFKGLLSSLKTKVKKDDPHDKYIAMMEGEWEKMMNAKN